MENQAAEAALETYKEVRRRFYESADEIFGPGFLSMTEYYYMKTTGNSPFATLFSEPRTVYDEWVRMFKGEEPVRNLIERVAGPQHTALLKDIQRNDGVKVWNFFSGGSPSLSLAA